LQHPCQYCERQFSSATQLYGHLAKHKDVELRCCHADCGIILKAGFLQIRSFFYAKSEIFKGIGSQQETNQ
jgi:hypothetical protein